MKALKRVIRLVGVFVFAIFFPSNTLFAQIPVIMDTLAYTQISNLTDINPATRIRTSADGSKIIFTGNYKQIFTMNSDGSQLTQIFDYETFRPGTPPYADPFVDISGDGSTILWTDGANEIFTANFNGSNSNAIATIIPNELPFADVEPDIRLSPRLTYDGSTVFFTHVSDNPNVAGIYTVSSNGSGLTKLFSYTDISTNLFGLDASEYNYNTAFTCYLDISDDGSKGVFATHSIDWPTGHTIGFNNSSLSNLLNYAPTLRSPSSGIGQLSISRDGEKVALHVSDESGWVSQIHVMDFSGENQTELPFLFHNFYSQVQLDSSGSNAISTSHWSDHGESSLYPISYIDIDSTRILDLTLLEGNPDITFRGARIPVITPNAKTVFFVNGLARGDSIEQIWKLDINPGSLLAHPTISNINFSPNYVLFDQSNSSTFSATVAPGSSSLLYVNWDTFSEGSYVFRSLRTWGGENLVDDGTLGDAVAGDGIYTREEVYADLLEPPATLTIRIYADAGKYITSVDVAPFFVWDSVATSIASDNKQGLLNKYELYTNFPNPFNPSTKIKYSIPNSNFVTVNIYDMLGRKIQTLVRKFQNADTYSIDFDASNLSSGIYFYSLQVGDDFLDTKKMLLMK